MKEKYIYKSKMNGRFTQVPNSLIEDERISIAGRMIMIYALSRPDNYKLHQREIQRVLGMGSHKVINEINELEATGFVIKIKQKAGKNGRYDKQAPTLAFFADPLLKEQYYQEHPTPGHLKKVEPIRDNIHKYN